MAYFIFNNISSEDMGIKITSMSSPHKAAQQQDVISIPGSPVPLIHIYDQFDNTEHDITFVLAYKTKEEIRNIFSWLSGTGKFIRSDENDKYYTANMSAELITERISDDIYEASIKMICLPFAYAVDNAAVEITGNDYALEVAGNYYAQPVYKIFGSGNITLKVNNTDKPLTLFDVDDYVTVDTALLDCHKDGIHVKNAGVLPFLDVGTNRIQWSGSVTHMEVIRNERWT